jgi:hypothetical protein
LADHGWTATHVGQPPECLKNANTKIPVRITLDRTENRYVVRHPHDRAANYHTNDKSDAEGAARAMVAELGYLARIKHNRTW